MVHLTREAALVMLPTVCEEFQNTDLFQCNKEQRNKEQRNKRIIRDII